MNALIICRPAAGVDPGREFPVICPPKACLPRPTAPGGPGAVLMLNVADLGAPSSRRPRATGSTSRTSSRRSRPDCLVLQQHLALAAEVAGCRALVSSRNLDELGDQCATRARSAHPGEYEQAGHDPGRTENHQLQIPLIDTEDAPAQQLPEDQQPGAR